MAEIHVIFTDGDIAAFTMRDARDSVGTSRIQMIEGGPTIVVLTGVSGVGKSRIGQALAARLGWKFVDGDAFHGAVQIAKMRTGQPLDDEDRTPWLARIADWIDAQRETGCCGIVACSALKRAYRDRLVRGRPRIRIVVLDGDPALIARRLATRHGHFMPPTLLGSQLATLERPEPDENAILVDIGAPPETIAATIATALEHAGS